MASRTFNDASRALFQQIFAYRARLFEGLQRGTFQVSCPGLVERRKEAAILSANEVVVGTSLAVRQAGRGWVVIDKAGVFFENGEPLKRVGRGPMLAESPFVMDEALSPEEVRDTLAAVTVGQAQDLFEILENPVFSL